MRSVDWVLWFGVCVCYLDVESVIVVWMCVMVAGWNLHNHLTTKKSFQDMGQVVMGFGRWRLIFKMFWDLGFGVFDAWFGVWGLGFGVWDRK